MFRTDFAIAPLEPAIDSADAMLALGSCFARHMGDRLAAHKLDCLVNPLGTLFQPLAISKVIRMALGDREPDPAGFVDQEDRHMHFDFHSDMRATDPRSLLELLRERLATCGTQLRKSRWLLLTPGTAWVYERKVTGQPVTNCHKVPADRFKKRLLSVKEILADYEQLLSLLQKEVPQLQILLSLSPVRHIKDTIPANSASKAVLRLACHELSSQYAHVHYFPAYEIMMDDLRDYRFYEADMLHPNTVAIDYIWEKFGGSCLNEKAQNLITEWSGIRQAMAHKPFNPASEAHQRFLRKLLQRVQQLSTKVDVSKEISEISQQLHDGQSKA